MQTLLTDRSPVRRLNAENYLLLTLISFGLSVFITRLFLEITNYPQIGNETLHIAHVLWGGLFLFIATLIPLMLANRWAFNVSAIAGGIGFGLFIDEVGKFITRTNDYFYQPAAPIIYASFILVVLIYVHFKKPNQHTSREETYQVLNDLKEVLDQDLSAKEMQMMLDRTNSILSKSTNEGERELVVSIQNYLKSEHAVISSRANFWYEDLYIRGSNFVTNLFNKFPFRTVLVIGLGLTGLLALSRLVFYGLYAFDLANVAIYSQADAQSSPLVDIESIWFWIRILAQGFVGLFSFLSAILLILRRDSIALDIGILGLTVSLTVVNLLIFYLDQFSAIFGTLLEFGLLMIALEFRRRKSATQSTESA